MSLLRQSLVILLKPQSDRVTLLALAYNSCCYPLTALPRADQMSLRTQAHITLLFIFQQQQRKPFFSHWPIISCNEPIGPQTSSENFCPWQQFKLPKANRPFLVGSGNLFNFIFVTDFMIYAISLFLPFAQIPSSWSGFLCTQYSHFPTNS